MYQYLEVTIQVLVCRVAIGSNKGGLVKVIDHPISISQLLGELGNSGPKSQVIIFKLIDLHLDCNVLLI